MNYYTTLHQQEAQGSFQDRQKGVWGYLSPRQYRGLPQEQRRICGDMRKQDSAGMDRILEGQGCRIGLYQYRPQLKWNEKVVGYIPVSTQQGEQAVCCVRIVDTSYEKMVLYPLFLVLFMASVVVGILWYQQQGAVPGLDRTAVAYHIDGMSNPDPDEIMMPLVPEIQIAKGETHIRELLINPEGNQCYFTFQFVLEETGEVIYESGLVEPGKAVVDFDLNQTLEVGEHKVTVKIITTDLENMEKALNGGDMNTVIRVVE